MFSVTARCGLSVEVALADERALRVSGHDLQAWSQRTGRGYHVRREPGGLAHVTLLDLAAGCTLTEATDAARRDA